VMITLMRRGRTSRDPAKSANCVGNNRRPLLVLRYTASPDREEACPRRIACAEVAPTVKEGLDINEADDPKPIGLLATSKRDSQHGRNSPHTPAEGRGSSGSKYRISTPRGQTLHAGALSTEGQET
jgi:hypothetical protein